MVKISVLVVPDFQEPPITVCTVGTPQMEQYQTQYL
jgi:hypothetical protein